MMTLQQQLGYEFTAVELLEEALTHRSFHNENPSASGAHNERLEFLGDAVLDLSLSHFLMQRFPDFDEGRLSKLRASLVNEEFLSQLAIKLQINETLRLGRGERKSGGDAKPRLLASALEAVIGSIFLDADFDSAHQVICRLFESEFADIDWTEHQARDFKTQLQEFVQSQFKETPSYRVINETGPDHEKSFEVEVFIGTRTLATGTGKSKKQAEQQAARKALEVRHGL